MEEKSKFITWLGEGGGGGGQGGPDGQRWAM